MVQTETQINQTAENSQHNMVLRNLREQPPKKQLAGYESWIANTVPGTLTTAFKALDAHDAGDYEAKQELLHQANREEAHALAYVQRQATGQLTEEDLAQAEAWSVFAKELAQLEASSVEPTN